jgi:hypothetical protein
MEWVRRSVSLLLALILTFSPREEGIALAHFCFIG